VGFLIQNSSFSIGIGVENSGKNKMAYATLLSAVIVGICIEKE
jgi:hypothetical protein